MAKWTNRTAGVAARNGTNAHTITFSTDGGNPFTPTDGRLLVILVDAPVTHTWPGGWTERLAPVNFSELSVATKVASSDTSVTITHGGSNAPMIFAAYEFPADTTWVDGVGASNTGRTAAQPTLSGLSGDPVTIMFAAARVVASTTATCTATWGTPPTEDVDHGTVASGTDGAWLSTGYEDDVTSTSVTTTPTITTVGDEPVDGYERVTFALDVPSGADEVTGTASGALGALTGSAVGVRAIAGTAARNLGALAGVAAGTRAVLGTAARNLGSLTATAAGTRTALGVAGRNLGALSGTAVGFTGEAGAAGGVLGVLTGQASGTVTSPEIPRGSWGTLISISREAHQIVEEDRVRRPVACPNDGEPLTTGPSGVLHCRFDGWREGVSEWH